MRAIVITLVIWLFTGTEGVNITTLPTYFTVNGEPATIKATVSNPPKGTLTWLLERTRKLASVNVDIDDSGQVKLSGLAVTNKLVFKFEADGQQVLTSVTIDSYAVQFNGTTLELSSGNKRSNRATIIFTKIAYVVKVDTGDKVNEGIDAEISITIFGDFGKGATKLLGNVADYRKTAGKRVITMKSGNVGRIEKVKIGHRSKSTDTAWYLRNLQIEDPSSGYTYVFTVDGWMDSLENGELRPGVSRNQSQDECEKPPIGHPNYGIVGKNATVTQNCTQPSCEVTWTCFANVTCGIVGTECECQGDSCSSAFNFKRNSILVTALSFTVGFMLKVLALREF